MLEITRKKEKTTQSSPTAIFTGNVIVDGSYEIEFPPSDRRVGCTIRVHCEAHDMPAVDDDDNDDSLTSDAFSDIRKLRNADGLLDIHLYPKG